MIASSESPINPGGPIAHNWIKKNGNVEVIPAKIMVGNQLTDEVNRDHAALMGRKPHLAINSNKLISGIRKHGFKNFTKGRRFYWDPRGRPKAQISRLAQLNSTKDPNSLLRSAHDTVEDKLATAKGFSNEAMFWPAYDEHMSRVGNDEHRTYKSINRRFIDPGKNRELVINDNMMRNIDRYVKLE